MIPDSQSRRLADSDSGSLLGGGLVLLAFGVALVVLGLWAPGESGGPPNQLLLVAGLVGVAVGGVLCGVGATRLATKVDDIHRMTLAAHRSRTQDEVAGRRASSDQDVRPSP
ncbi:MAG TPA: hypothetical protein VHO27_04590 [Angustibacter sp.]|nr:hypothetical protein [Angustibacter sp.]